MIWCGLVEALYICGVAAKVRSDVIVILADDLLILLRNESG